MRVSTTYLHLTTDDTWTAFYIPPGGRIVTLTYNGPGNDSVYVVEHNKDPEPGADGWTAMDKYLIKGHFEDLSGVGSAIISTDGTPFWLIKVGATLTKPGNGSGTPRFVEPEPNSYQKM